jgi:hypothetical protein
MAASQEELSSMESVNEEHKYETPHFAIFPERKI